MMDTCDYFLFDEDHPTYGELCGRPATKEFMAFGSPFPVCSGTLRRRPRRALPNLSQASMGATRRLRTRNQCHLQLSRAA